MATVFTVKSLEEFCLTHIVMTLEQHSTDSLALLPKDFRVQLLHKIPVVDVCRLEGSEFTSGICMETLWKELYIALIDPHPFTPKQGWRDHFLMKLFSTILRGERPYGYFQVMSRSQKRTPWVGSNMNEDRPVHEHRVDFVNYLVAVKNEVPPLESVKEEEDEEEVHYRSRYGPVNVTMNRHEVTLVKGPIPPGKVYHQACLARQLVPPRYTKFSEGSCYLPDSTALELISRECHFRPKQMSVYALTFNTFLLNAEKERDDLDFLADFFKDVESLAIEGVVEESRRASNIRGTRHVKSKGIASKALELVLQTTNPKLAAITIGVSNKRDDVIASITPLLTTSYSGLKELTLRANGEVSPDIQKLISISENQPYLHTVSISVTEVTNILSSFGPVLKYTPDLSQPLLRSWLQVCFQKPTLCHLKLTLSKVSTDFLVDVLVLFLSAPCSHEQTLTYRMRLGEDSPRANVKSTFANTSTSRRVPSNQQSSIEAPPPEPAVAEVPSSSSLHTFNEKCTLQYKFLVFDCCTFTPSFTDAFLKLAPLKLKRITINDLHYSETPVFLSQLSQQRLLEMETLEVTSVGFRSNSCYSDFLQRRLLKTIVFNRCTAIDSGALHKVAILQGFEFEETVVTEYKTERFSYTLTRK